MGGETLISANDTIGVFTAIVTIVATGMAMERHPKLGQYGAMFVILFPALLTSLSVLPKTSPVYGFVAGPMVAFAIPMLLFNADLKVVWKQSGRVMTAFLLATAATVVGAIAGAALVDLGPSESNWVGVLTAAFIGGSVNYAAVSGSLNITDTAMVGLFIAAVYVVIIPYFILLMSMPRLGLIWRLFAVPDANTNWESLPESESGEAGLESRKPFEPFGFSAMIAVAGICVVIGEVIAAITGVPALKFLGLTLVAILIATFGQKAVGQMRGHTESGHVLIYAFLAVIGTGIDFSVVSSEALPIIIFVIVLLAVHLILVSLFGRLLKLSGPELLVASNACILGPPTAAAMATAQGWSRLVSPGILVGVFGWAIASFIGVGVALIL